MSKHDQKTRHVGLGCVHCWGPFGLAQLLGGSGGRGATALPMVRGSASLPWVIRPARRAGPTSWSRQARPLPWFRADGGYSVPLFAAQSRHEKPYPPMSKINFAFPFTVPFKGNGESIPHSPAQRKRGFGETEVVGRICESYRNYETSAKMVGSPRRGDRRRDWQCDSTLMAARSASGPYQLSCLHDSRMRPKLWVWLPPI